MEAVLIELFSHLPAKSIYKFSKVSKQCYRFLSEDFFATKQCKNLKDREEDSCFFLLPTVYSEASSPIKLYYLSRIFKSFCGIPTSSLDILSREGHVLASSNGVLCCKRIEESEYPILLCNPVTKRWLNIVKPARDYNPSHHMTIVFACNENDYMLMYLESNLDSWAGDSDLIKIYSPQRGVWEELGPINVGSRNIDFGLPVYLNNGGGTIYFMSDWNDYIKRDSVYYWPYIVSYNIRNAVSGFLRIPKAARKGGFDDRSCFLGIFKFKDGNGETICFIKSMKLVFSVWVLTDTNEWKIILKSRVKALGLYANGNAKPVISGFTVMNGNVLVIATGAEVYKYTLSGLMKSNSLANMEKIGWNHSKRYGVYFHPYSNTLRSCGDGATTMVRA